MLPAPCGTFPSLGSWLWWRDVTRWRHSCHLDMVMTSFCGHAVAQINAPLSCCVNKNKRMSRESCVPADLVYMCSRSEIYFRVRVRGRCELFLSFDQCFHSNLFCMGFFFIWSVCQTLFGLLSLDNFLRPWLFAPFVLLVFWGRLQKVFHLSVISAPCVRKIVGSCTLFITFFFFSWF